MDSIENIITENIEVWSSAIKQRNTQGRGSSKRQELYGVQKLRELILELAVRGLLVPQDSSDEPASVLLKKIASEKEQLIKDKKIKKPKKLPAISDNEQFGTLPHGWEYVRLNDIGEWGAGATPRRSSIELYGGDIPWFKSGELIADYIYESEETVTEEALNKASLRYNKAGDVLLAMYGATIGKTAILAVPGTTNQAICACTPFTGFSNTFLLTLLKAYRPRFIGMGAGGAQPNISREKIIATVIALPPENEQERIVAKVDELMALCDQLEQQQENSIAAHQQLVEILLAALTQGVDNESFEQAWSRIAANFDTLFITENSIDQLKQTLLQLAVMGKLVPQDPSDEPASVLLKKIAAEKERLIKEGKIKKQKPLPEIDHTEQLFSLTEGAQWVRLGELSLSSEAGWSPRCEGHPATEGNWGVLKVSAVSWGEFKAGENKALPSNLKPREQYEVAPGDFLISRANTAELVARAVIVPVSVPKKLMMSDKIIRFRFSKEVDTSYIGIVNSSQAVRDYYSQIAGGTSSSMKNVSRDQIRNLVFALPPLNEQKRIVEKVDQLFAICDQLKAKINTAQQTQLQLADAISSQAVQ